jgi:hypothetical protein
LFGGFDLECRPLMAAARTWRRARTSPAAQFLDVLDRLSPADCAPFGRGCRRKSHPPFAYLKCLQSPEPGKTWAKAAWAGIDLADLSQIPAEALLLLTVNGDSDRLVRDIEAKRIFTTAGPR